MSSQDLLEWSSADESSKAAAAIASVRKDSDDSDWCYITFAGTTGPASKKLKHGGVGSGGADALKKNLADDQIAFALVRINDKVDNSVTVKFVWVNWLGNNVGTMQKARLSTLLGAVQDFFGQSHLQHTCNTHEEISDFILRSKVMATSGTGSKVLDSTGKASLTSQAAGKVEAGSRSGGKKTDELSFDPACATALHKVRKDDFPETWAALAFDSSYSTLSVQATGTGGVNEVVSQLHDDKVVYVLLRKLEKIDQTEAVKFCYIRWLGENIPTMVKAKLGATAGQINNFFLPYHVSLDSPDKHEVNDQHIMKLISSASGTYEHTLSDTNKGPQPKAAAPAQAHAPAAQVQRSPSTQGKATLSSGASQSTNVASAPKVQRGTTGERQSSQSTALQGAISIQDEEKIQSAIKGVRSDSDPHDWVLVTYTAPKSNTVKFHATGQGGVDEMKTHFKDDVVMYGILRVTEKIDDTVAVKFCFVDWRGENINRMQRANLGIHSGDVGNLLRPFHVDVQCSDHSEITLPIVMAKVNAASGTAVHVL